MLQLNRGVNTGHHGSTKVKADWGGKVKRRENFSLLWGGAGNRSHNATQYKKNMCFIHALDLMLL